MSADTGGTDEIRNAAASWTMAHDKLLLGHLNRFGDNMHKRTEEMKRKLSALRGDTKRAEDALGLLTNEFMVMANEVYVVRARAARVVSHIRCNLQCGVLGLWAFVPTMQLVLLSSAIHRGQSIRRRRSRHVQSYLHCG